MGPVTTQMRLYPDDTNKTNDFLFLWNIDPAVTTFEQKDLGETRDQIIVTLSGKKVAKFLFGRSSDSKLISNPLHLRMLNDDGVFTDKIHPTVFNTGIKLLSDSSAIISGPDCPSLRCGFLSCIT